MTDCPSDREVRRLAFVLPDMRAGGAERVALSLIRDFAARGHETDLVLLDARGELLQLLPPAVRVFDLRAPRFRAGLWPLVRYLRARRPDAVQVSMWPTTILAIVAHRVARSRARLVTSDHTLLSRHVRPAALPALRWTTRLFYPMADARIVVAADAADDLSRLSGLDRGSLDVIYNPVDVPATAQPQGAEAVWRGAGIRILTVGSLKPEKRHDLLLRSFASAFCGRDARLVLVGEGALRETLAELADELGIAGQVTFAGFQRDPTPFYATAGLFALSSDYEGFPLVLVEALRAGLPIVSTDCVSGPREILDGGRYGRLVPVGDADALARALVETPDRPVDPAALRSRAEALSGRHIYDRYLELLLGQADDRPQAGSERS